MNLASFRSLAVAALALGFGSCATTDPELLAPDGRPLAQVAAAPYRVAVTPVRVSDVVEASLSVQQGELQFTIPTTELQEHLIAKMSQLNAATEVLAAVDREDALSRGADLVLEPRLRTAPELGHESLSGKWLLSGVLWLTTWIGGLAVDDSTYEARIALDCDLVNAHDDERPIAFTANSGLVDLGFWDRNDALTLGFFSTFILPPFWTTDTADVTSDSLSRRALGQLAGRMTNFLKFDLIEREKDAFGQVVFSTLTNGDEVGTSVRVAGEIVARGPIFGIRLRHNGKTLQDLRPHDLKAGIDQQQGSEFRQDFDFEVNGLVPGENTLSLRVRVEDAFTSRTLTVYRGKRPAR